MAAKDDDDFVSEINVTPLVDVMLVLLIIFMITAPMMVEGLDVELPQTRVSELLPAEDDHAVLTIKADGSLWLDEFETSPDDLPALLESRVKASGKRLFLRADRNVSYGLVMDALDRVKGAGIADLGMVTAPVPTDQTDQTDRPGQTGRTGADGGPEKDG
ncbi:MAG: ExbD/TolR family protein [Deltaproteobacteria bacterium]|nr:ExbD/TolR family protein [Deltaproteobacteria bacterium]